MATMQDIEQKLAQYNTARADREQKQAKHEQDVAALNAAVVTEQASHDAWIAALNYEHQVEDELEALIIDYEPPQVPMAAPASAPAAGKKK